MTITVSNETQEGSVSNYYGDKIVIDAGGPGSGLIVSPGFIPRYIKLINVTDASKYEWMDQFGTGAAAKTVTAGTFTIQAANGFSVGASAAVGNGTTVPGEGQVFIDPALLPASKTCFIQMFG